MKIVFPSKKSQLLCHHPYIFYGLYKTNSTCIRLVDNEFVLSFIMKIKFITF